MSRLCVDTSAYTHFRRNDPKVVSWIDAANEVFVPAVVLGELRAGFRLGKLEAENEAALRAFLNHPAVAVVDVDDETSSHYADLWVELREAGTPIPTNDVWVGASALQSGSVVLTYDQHFLYMQRVGSTVLKS